MSWSCSFVVYPLPTWSERCVPHQDSEHGTFRAHMRIPHHIQIEVFSLESDSNGKSSRTRLGTCTTSGKYLDLFPIVVQRLSPS